MVVYIYICSLNYWWDSMSYIRYFGHSSFEVMLGDTLMFIDPYFALGERRKYPSARKDVHDVKRCDLILLTHEHFDHCEPATVAEIAERTFATVVGPKPALAEIRIPEKLKVDVKVGDMFQLKGVNIDVVQAVHPQSAYPVGYVLEADGKRIYAAGDTYEFSGMMNISCDWALIPIGGTYTMDIIGAEKAAREIKASRFIPTHYATFDNIDVDPNEFAKALAGDPKKKAVVMKFGEKIEI